MIITKLEVVNGCLATLGETPLSSLEDFHTYLPAALNFLTDSTREMQADGYWFNSEYVALAPDPVTSRITTPADALLIRPIKRVSPPYGNRGKYLYDTENNTLEWTKPVVLEVIRSLSFEDTPYIATVLIKYDTILKFQKEYDADAQKLRLLMEQRMDARAKLRAEDIRNRKNNLLLTPSNIAAALEIAGYGTRGSRIPIR